MECTRYLFDGWVGRNSERLPGLYLVEVYLAGVLAYVEVLLGGVEVVRLQGRKLGST